MLVLIAAVLALIPTLVIVYPFLRGSGRDRFWEDENPEREDLVRRLNAALAALRNGELEWDLGHLAEEDYRWLRQRHMTEAALIMKAMELEDAQERALRSTIEREIEQVRRHPLRQQGRSPSEELTVE